MGSNATSSLSASAGSSHAQNRIFLEKALKEDKGVPRMRDVVDQILDLQELVEVDDVLKIPQDSKGKVHAYLVLQGIDSHQKAM